MASPATYSDPDEQTTMSSKKKSEPPRWSVVSNPEIRKVLDIEIAHDFTYQSRVLCVNMSPDGQRVALGLEYDGSTYIKDVKTGSKIWLVSERLLRVFDSVVSVFLRIVTSKAPCLYSIYGLALTDNFLPQLHLTAEPGCVLSVCENFH
jgi:WD40 repeat protein